MRRIIIISGIIMGYYALTALSGGCAQISAPTGGDKDTIPPKLVRSNPEINTLNFRGNKINFTFNENIDLQDLQSNLVISPLQKNSPTVSSDRKSLSIKFKDTLLPNTTYSINFGNAIVDIRESNILRDFTFVFSTGNTIDSLTLEGNVVMAESGKADSTLIVMLYRNMADSAVLKTKPDYIAKLDGEGNFKFRNLSNSDFNIYALKDGDGGKTYNSKTELFAFDDSTVNSSQNTVPIILYAYAEQKADTKIPGKITLEKKLRYTSNQTANTQDILQPLELSFNNPLKKFDGKKIILSDTSYNPYDNYTITIDSTRKKISLNTSWRADGAYYLILPRDIAEDSAGNMLAKTDTILFITKKTTEYGSLILRFTNIDLSKHPLIQFLDGENLKFSYPIVSTEWSSKLFPPGEYVIRIIYDLNNNGKWDPGNYQKKIQPEKGIQLSQKLSIKADWENERDIKL